MKRTSKLLGAASFLTLSTLIATPAFAQNTEAGTTITNTVQVNYQVGGVAQDAETASDTFAVDRKIDLTVVAVADATVASPGETEFVRAFDVTNLSNDVLDFALSVEQGGGDFNTTNAVIWVDSDNNGIFDENVDTQVAYIDELAADINGTDVDNTTRVFVVSDVPLTATDDQTADIILVATAHEGGGAAVQGAIVTETADGAITMAGEDTMFADIAGDATGDGVTNGQHSDTNTITVAAAALTVAKQSRVVSDPIRGTASPMAIPGSVIEYCISISNAAGSAEATTVAISDIIPANLTYLTTNYVVQVDGVYDGTASFCTIDPTNDVDGTYVTTPNPTVSGTITAVAAGETKTLYFQATID